MAEVPDVLDTSTAVLTAITESTLTSTVRFTEVPYVPSFGDHSAFSNPRAQHAADAFIKASDFDHQRLLLACCTEDDLAKLHGIAEFLQGCGFHRLYLHSPPKSSSDLIPSSGLPDARVGQIICLVICSREFRCRMEDFLEFLDGFKDDANQLLLFCKAADWPGDPSDEKLHKTFSLTDFRYKKAIIGYAECHSENIGDFFQHLQENLKNNWSEVCIGQFVKETVCVNGKLYFKPRFDSRLRFLREIKQPCEFQGPVRIPSADSFVNEMDSKVAASLLDFVYPNGRSKKPQALIILNIDHGTGIPVKSMHADWRHLLWLFEKLQYEVKDAQTDAGSPGQLESCVEHFVKSESHGDSSVLIVLSDCALDHQCIEKMNGSVATGEHLKGRPRLVIVQQWVGQELEGADTGMESVAQFLPNAEASLRDQWKNDRPQVKLHPLSGMIWCQSKTSAADSSEGSPLIRTMCEVFIGHAATKDVASMISLINEGAMRDELSDEPPQWCVQTSKLFFITSTDPPSRPGELSAAESHIKHQSSEPRDPLETLKKMADEVPEEDDTAKLIRRDAFGRPGAALIITEGLYDPVRDYQMFLEIAGFRVFAERCDDVTTQSVCDIIASSSINDALSIVLIVKRHRSESDSEGVTEIINRMESMSTEASSLLLYFEVASSSESCDVVRLPDTLPPRFTIVSCHAISEQIDSLLRGILEEPREKLQGSLLVGCDFKKLATENLSLVYTSSEENPEWMYSIKWPGSQAIIGSGTSKEEIFSTESMRRKWHPERSSCPAPRRTLGRALIIQNIYDAATIDPKRTRHGSQNDCQRLLDCLTELGLRVSIRSNLTGDEMLRELQSFAGAPDHGRTCAVAIMSHGCFGKILDCNNKAVKEKTILQKLNEGAGVKGKQKLVIFQACRPFDNNPADSAETGLLVYPDMIIAHSASPNEYSYRNPLQGSRFVQSLSSVLSQFGADSDIVSLISAVNYLMMSCFYISENSAEQLPYWLVQTRGPFLVGDVRPQGEKLSGDSMWQLANLLKEIVMPAEQM